MDKYEKITLGAGCFWGPEKAFQEVEGVVSTRVGYAGGTLEDPTYEDVCRGDTGHTEVVEVTYDPSIVSTEEILKIFFEIHDPTEVHRQGPDVGYQYRSVIFYHSEEQKGVAHMVMEEVADSLHAPLATSLEPISTFYEAEAYHQSYFKKNPGDPRCH